MPEPDLLSPLRNGRIVQVLIVYLGVSWVVVQVVLAVRDLIGLPQWIGPVTLVLLLIGLVVVAATAWVQGAAAHDAEGVVR